MFKYDTFDDFYAAVRRLDDSPYLAKRLNELATHFQDVDSDKVLLLTEAANNLIEAYAALHYAAGRACPPIKTPAVLPEGFVWDAEQ